VTVKISTCSLRTPAKTRAASLNVTKKVWRTVELSPSTITSWLPKFLLNNSSSWSRELILSFSWRVAQQVAAVLADKATGSPWQMEEKPPWQSTPRLEEFMELWGLSLETITIPWRLPLVEEVSYFRETRITLISLKINHLSFIF